MRQELLAEGGTVLSSVAEQAVIRQYKVTWPGRERGLWWRNSVITAR